MDAGLIDIKDLAGYLKKKWIIILTAVLLCGILFNFYGISRENRDATNIEQRHMEYVEAAEKLPGYYTEALFNLRSRLSDHAAGFVEAYAHIYKSFLKEYQPETESINTENLEAYMMFLDSYKDVLSVMSGTQREYYEMLLAIDTEAGMEGHPIVENYNRSDVPAIQPEWIVIGFGVGAIVSVVLLALISSVKRPEKK